MGFYSPVSIRPQCMGEAVGVPVFCSWKEKAERRLHQC